MSGVNQNRILPAGQAEDNLPINCNPTCAAGVNTYGNWQTLMTLTRDAVGLIISSFPGATNHVYAVRIGKQIQAVPLVIEEIGRIFVYDAVGNMACVYFPHILFGNDILYLACANWEDGTVHTIFLNATALN